MAIVVGTGVLGAAILSQQSWTHGAPDAGGAGQGQPPVAPVLDGVFLVLAAALLHARVPERRARAAAADPAGPALAGALGRAAPGAQARMRAST